MKEYMEKITTSMDEFRLELRRNTAAIHARTAKLDDLTAWRPDLERRVDLLADAVADLQQGRLPAAAAPGVAAKEISALDSKLGTGTAAISQPHRSADHGDAFLH